MNNLAPVAQNLHSAIHWINHYPVDKYEKNQLHYPLDRDSGGLLYLPFEQLGAVIFILVRGLNKLDSHLTQLRAHPILFYHS